MTTETTATIAVASVTADGAFSGHLSDLHTKEGRRFTLMTLAGAVQSVLFAVWVGATHNTVMAQTQQTAFVGRVVLWVGLLVSLAFLLADIYHSREINDTVRAGRVFKMPNGVQSPFELRTLTITIVGVLLRFAYCAPICMWGVLFLERFNMPIIRTIMQLLPA